MSTTPSASLPWPLPSLHFQVSWNGAVMSFEQLLEHDALALQTLLDTPPAGPITLQHGLFRAGHRFWDWFDQIKNSALRRAPAIITQLDADGRAIQIWTLSSAWPIHVSGTNLCLDGTEVAISQLAIAHDGLQVLHH